MIWSCFLVSCLPYAFLLRLRHLKKQPLLLNFMDWLHVGEDFLQSAELETPGSCKPVLRMHLLCAWAHAFSPLKLPKQLVPGSSQRLWSLAPSGICLQNGRSNVLLWSNLFSAASKQGCWSHQLSDSGETDTRPSDNPQTSQNVECTFPSLASVPRSDPWCMRHHTKPDRGSGMDECPKCSELSSLLRSDPFLVLWWLRY